MEQSKLASNITFPKMVGAVSLMTSSLEHTFYSHVWQVIH